MFFDYLCQTCGRGTIYEDFAGIGQPHPLHRRCVCGGVLRRSVSHVRVVKGMSWDFQPHYNDTVGAPVSSMHEFNELLKVRSMEQTENTGMEHNYQPVDPRDRAAFGITDEALESIDAANRGVDLDSHMKQKALSESEAEWGDAPILEGEKT